MEVQESGKLRIGYLVALILVLSTAGVGHAAPTTFSDRTAWEAAIGAPTDIFVDFNEFDQDTGYEGIPLDLGPFSISVQGTPIDGRHMIDVAPFFNTSVDGTPYADVFINRGLTSRITFDTPVLAWGFDIFAAGRTDFPLFMDLETTSGTQSVSLIEPTSLVFFGVVMDPIEAISSITFRNATNDGFGLDNIAAASVPVPEPSTGLLLGLGLAFFAARKEGGRA
jgi:hypothetical protein